MANSETEICNSALIKIGGKRIVNLSENSKEARLCKELYPLKRDETLEAHPWKFAMARTALAKTSNTPVFGYDSEFQLPTDCLRIILTNLLDLSQWTREGDKLLANDTTVSILYIKAITDVSRFSKTFTEALANLLASELAYPIAQSTNLSDYYYKKFRAVIADARSFNAQEGFTRNQIEANTWLNARYSRFTGA